MAQPVTYSVDLLKIKIAELLIECNERSKREDSMAAEIQQLKVRLAATAADRDDTNED